MSAHTKDGGPAITDSERLAFMIKECGRVFQINATDRWICEWIDDEGDEHQTMMHLSPIEAIDAAMTKAREVQ